MTAGTPKQSDREQARESVNTLRFLGGMFLVVALLLYFFHLAEAPMGQYAMAVLAAVFGVIGVLLLWMGQRRLRDLR
jgi:Na+/melibiose symporter-like transporter